MSIEIADFRQSFIWAATVLGADRPVSTKLGQRAGYAAVFDTARAAKRAGPFVLPWPAEHPYAHKFWVRYLGLANPSNVAGDRAWTRGVPLRAADPPATVSMEGFAGRIPVEFFFYPFGVGLIVTFCGTGPLTDYDWVDTLLSTGQQPLSVTFAGGEAQSMTLGELAGESLQRMREDHFGAAAPELAPSDPFSVTTVIAGSGVDPAAAPADNQPIHRMLYGAATRRPNYKDAALPPLAAGKTLLEIREGAAPGDVVFATRRDRAIWFPSSFTRKAADKKDNGASAPKPRVRAVSLACYHRNQVFAALQAESLGCLARELTTRIAANPTLPPAIDQFGRMPAEILADMHDGKATTYRSATLKLHIVDRGLVDDIKALRTRYALPPWP